LLMGIESRLSLKNPVQDKRVVLEKVVVRF
jgi:hypothetical protein